MMGMLKEFIRGVKNDPLIPGGKEGRKPAIQKEVPKKVAHNKEPFCEEGSQKPCLTVCSPVGTCKCQCGELREKLTKEIAARGLRVTVGTAKTGCSGTCENGPFIGFPQKSFFYKKVKLEDVSAIVQETLINGRLLFELLSINPDRSYREDILFERATGTIVTIDDSVSMVDVGRYFLEFEKGLSCGKCTPCRIGLHRMHESMGRIVAGDGTTDDVKVIKELCRVLENSTYCDFAAASSKPINSAVSFFETEFQAVVKEAPVPEEKPKKSAEEKKKRVAESEAS
jgi:(2Fe-2S) ferredoxin